MAIDYVIDYACVPKATLTTEGIIDRIKFRERALAVIRTYRQAGDMRPPTEMGFEFTRSQPDGSEDTQLIIVQNALDNADALDTLAHHCEGCPANAARRPFGCMNFIQYPISAAAERWLLDQLPAPDEPILWLLLRQSVQEMQYDGESVRPMRANSAYFEESRVAGRDMVEFVLSANQVFEMLFLLGHVQPPHAAMLLLFFHAVPRKIEANVVVQIMNQMLTPEQIDQHFPSQMKVTDADDLTISELKRFFHALWLAWKLDVLLLLDG
ncbi:MAG: hypothetical protein SF162_17380 [bacterium]|nr:hypothetical protein [bacterium]